MASKSRSDEGTPGVVLLYASGRGHRATSEFPGNGKGIWEAHHYLSETDSDSVDERINNYYSKLHNKINYRYLGSNLLM